MFVWDRDFVFFPRGSGAGFENEIKKRCGSGAGKTRQALRVSASRKNTRGKKKRKKRGFMILVAGGVTAVLFPVYFLQPSIKKNK